MTALATLETVRALEAVMRQMDGQIDADALTSHTFCEGLYMRRLFLPAETTAVGKQHAQQNIFMLVSGELTLHTEAGPVRITAPYVAITQPGDKRAVYAHVDSVCVNIHPNPDNERDLAVLESRYIVPEALPAPPAQERIA